MEGRIDGVVLCKVGSAGLAVACKEVDAIADVDPSAIDAAWAYGDRGTELTGRAVQSRGRQLRVDSVDVVALEGVPVLAVPFALSRLADGSISGFVELSGALWPLVDVVQLVMHLEHTREVSPP